MLTGLAIALLVLVLVGVIRAIFEPRRPFIKAFNEETKLAYFSLIFAAAALLISAHLDLHKLRLNSVKIGEMEAKFDTLEKKVDTLSEQLKDFFKYRKKEIFDRHNWNRVHVVSKPKDGGVVLEITLEQEPIPGSVEILEGPIVMPEPTKIDGKTIQFEANSDDPDASGLTIKYSYLPPKN